MWLHPRRQSWPWWDAILKNALLPWRGPFLQHLLKSPPAGLTPEQRRTKDILRHVAAAVVAMFTEEIDKYPRASSIQELMKQLQSEAYLTDRISTDGWGHSLVYVASRDRKHFRLISPGADGGVDERSLVIGSSVLSVKAGDLNADLMWEDDYLAQGPQ
jgi:hypothetical protein